MTVTDDLCDFTANLTHTDLPAEVRAALADTTGNALCLMVGAARHPAVESAVSVLNTLSGPDSVPLLGRTDRLPGMWAALTHGIAGHVEDFDDTHPATIIHPGPPVVAAALSAAARVEASGTELLTAVAAGVEVALRVGLGIVPEALDRGWHMTGVAGPVGAAVAAGRLLGLRPDRLRNAVGLAATQSAGLLEALGTMARSLQPGKAAANGFEAAMLAHNGLDGPAAPLEGRRGLFALHAGRVDRPVLDGLGTRWELAANEIKPYACGVVSHALIDTALEARRFVSAPQRVALAVHPFVLVAMGRTEPVNALEAKFSATHCFAAGFHRGHVDAAVFTDHADPEVVALRNRCVLVSDESVPRYGVRAEITAADGTVWRSQRDHPARLDEEGVRRKAHALTRPVLGDRAEGFVTHAFDPGKGTVADLFAAGTPA